MYQIITKRGPGEAYHSNNKTNDEQYNCLTRCKENYPANN